ncbi:MAG: PEP-CTERM sorting domain-containing protein, partial [Verrucomicrobia bacterium]|nr:PEP-CTERM sorting domain-containing protein [Verrucomicrobiota bacterium]
ASGGTIAPGLSPGTLNIDGNLSIVDGSHFAFELGTTSDLLNIGGALNFTGGGTALFDILNSGGLTAGSNYTLMNYNSFSGLTLSNLALGSTPAGFAGQFTIGASSLTLHVDAVPEPSRAVLGGLGLAVLTLRRRRNARHLAKA